MNFLFKLCNSLTEFLGPVVGESVSLFIGELSTHLNVGIVLYCKVKEGGVRERGEGGWWVDSVVY